MRLSGLLVGGLIGAAAALLVSRKRPGAAAWAAGAVNEAYSAVTGRLVNGMMKNDWLKGAASSAPKSTDDTAANSAAAWERIEALMSRDEEAKREAEKIKAESSSMAH